MNYMRPHVSKDTFVQVDLHKGSEYVTLDIDMVFPQAPCQIFDFIVRTGYTEKVNHQIDGLKKQRIDKFAKNIPDNVKSGSQDTFAEQVRQQEGCRVIGKIELHKVPSTIYISTES
jgi:hypothetical protein